MNKDEVSKFMMTYLDECIFFDISIDLESISIETNFDSLSILDAIRIAE